MLPLSEGGRCRNVRTTCGISDYDSCSRWHVKSQRESESREMVFLVVKGQHRRGGGDSGVTMGEGGRGHGPHSHHGPHPIGPSIWLLIVRPSLPCRPLGHTPPPQIKNQLRHWEEQGAMWMYSLKKGGGSGYCAITGDRSQLQRNINPCHFFKDQARYPGHPLWSVVTTMTSFKWLIIYRVKKKEEKMSKLFLK